MALIKTLRSDTYGSAQSPRSFLTILINNGARLLRQAPIKPIDSVPDRLQAEPFQAFQPQGSIAMSKRDEYIEKMKLQLDELNAKMSELEAKAKEAKADAREKYTEEVGKLRQQSQRARAKLEELRVAGEDSWDAIVAEMEKIRDAFVHSFNYFKSQL